MPYISGECEHYHLTEQQRSDLDDLIAAGPGEGISDHENLTGIKGGAEGEHNHLTDAQVAAIGSGGEGGVSSHDDLTDIKGGDIGEHNHLTDAEVAALDDTVSHDDLTDIDGGDVGEYNHLTDAELAALGVPAHVDTTGLQGGTTNEYYHMTSAEHSAIGDIPDHKDTLNLQGGTTDEYYHLTSAQHGTLDPDHDDLSNISGGGVGEYNHVTDAELAAIGSGGGGGDHNDLGNIQGGAEGEYNHLTDAQVAALGSSNIETGTWTPTFTAETNNEAMTIEYATRVGVYQKIGTLVWASCHIVLSVFTKSSGANELRIAGLPYTTKAGTDYSGSIGDISLVTFPSSRYSVTVMAPEEENYVSFRGIGLGNASMPILVNAQSDNNNMVFKFDIMYEMEAA